MIYDIWIPGSILRSYVCSFDDMSDWYLNCLFVSFLLSLVCFSWFKDFICRFVCLVSSDLSVGVLGYLSLDSHYCYSTD